MLCLAPRDLLVVVGFAKLITKFSLSRLASRVSVGLEKVQIVPVQEGL